MAEPQPPRIPAAIEVDAVARSFGSVAAVRDASFRAEPGRVTGLIGPNGAGKTTLLLMLATLLAPDRGRISIGGVDPVESPRAARALIGWMPDVLGSWPSLSTRTALAITGRLVGLPKPDASARADELLQLVDLADLADAPTKVLSRGQKQRLSLARALVGDPSVLLLDEPASGLDPAARIELRRLVRRFAAEGRTVLVSSHVLAELDEMADAAVYLTAGVTASAAEVAAARAGRRPWLIRAIDPAALVESLAAAGIPRLPGDDPRGITVAFADEDEAATALETLIGAGVRVAAFGPAASDLEHTFLDLTADRSAESERGPR